MGNGEGQDSGRSRDVGRRRDQGLFSRRGPGEGLRDRAEDSGGRPVGPVDAGSTNALGIGAGGAFEGRVCLALEMSGQQWWKSVGGWKYGWDCHSGENRSWEQKARITGDKATGRYKILPEEEVLAERDGEKGPTEETERWAQRGEKTQSRWEIPEGKRGETRKKHQNGKLAHWHTWY